MFFKLDGFNAVMLHCHRGLGSVTVHACADSFQSCKHGRHTHRPCVGCPVGAALSGEKKQTQVPAKLCLRCGKMARRLIRSSVCLSCYNREREYLKGRNARGHMPVHAKSVASVKVAADGHVILIRCVTLGEAVLSTLKKLNDYAIAVPCHGPTA